MIKEQLTTDAALRTNNWGFFALRKIPVNCTQSRGAVLLIAILVASVALAVGLGVYNRTYKELLFASYWKQTQVGFSAADAGLECAVYNDTHPTGGVFPTISSSAQPFSCFGNNITGALEVGSPTGGVATSTFSAQVGNGCVNVTVVKSGVGGPFPLTFVATTSVAVWNGPTGVAISPDGTSVYVASPNDDSVYQYARATTTGALTPMTTPFISSPFAMWITVSPDGKFVYVTGTTGGTTIYKYPVFSTGALDDTSVVTYNTSSYGNPLEMVISSDGLSAYVAAFNPGPPNGFVIQYDRTVATGALTFKNSKSTTDQGLKSVVISSDDASVYAAGGSGIWQYSRDKTPGPTFGDLTTISPSPFRINPPFETGAPSPFGSIVVSPDGRSVYKTNNDKTVYQYSRATATGALASSSPYFTSTDPLGAGAQGIVISPDGSSVYVTNVGNGMDSSSITASQFARGATGLLSLMTPASTSTNLSGVAPTYGASNTDISGIAISRDGKSVYVTNFNENLIYQFSTPAGSSPLSTLINARGYNTPYNTSSFDCANTSPRRVERGLRVEY